MIRKIVVALMVASALLFGGCKKKQPMAEPGEPAKVEITEDNLNAELDKMEAEIEADIAAEQQ